MKIVALIQCSATKTHIPSKEMIWDSDTKIDKWIKSWNSQKNRYKAKSMYIGQSFKNNIKIINSTKNIEPWIISAGAGLLNLEDEIPAYESTFKNKKGPDSSNWHLLPMGNLSRIVNINADRILLFTTKSYQLSILNDPSFDKIKHKLVVISTSPLTTSGKIIRVHPRGKEILGVSGFALNSEYLRLYIEKGEDGFNKLYEKCNELPKRKKKKSLNDKELLLLVKQYRDIKTLTRIVRKIRDETDYGASYERIRDAWIIKRKDEA